MRHLVVTDENLGNEKRIVLEELRLRTENDPISRALVAAQRKLLGENGIEGRDGGYVLVAAPDEIDGARFESLLKEGKASIASDPAAAAGDPRRRDRGAVAPGRGRASGGASARGHRAPHRPGSPDGRWIVMSPPSGLGSTLYLMRADGSELFRIGFGTEPSWRPETP
jgi:hypothetical protein